MKFWDYAKASEAVSAINDGSAFMSKDTAAASGASLGIATNIRTAPGMVTAMYANGVVYV